MTRRKHKKPSKFGNINPQPDMPEYMPDFSLNSHITPEVKARADAEWDAMDARGNLPEGWAAQSGSV